MSQRSPVRFPYLPLFAVAVFGLHGELVGAMLPQGAAQSRPAKKAATQAVEKVPEAVVKEMLATADEIMGQVAKLRGMKWKHGVKKGVHSEAQLRRFLDRALEEEYAGGKMEKHQRMLETMGLLPKGVKLGKTIVDVLMNQVGGFYDPKRQAFFMMAKTRHFGPALNGMLIAHELCHALDDQYYSLDPLMKASGGTHDGDFAVGSVVEGSATALMTRWMLKYSKGFDRKAMKKMMKGEVERSRTFFEAPPYFRTLVAKYMLGANFLIRGKGIALLARSNETANVGVAMKKPPLSSEQILHPEKYWDEDRLDLPVRIKNRDALVAKLMGALGTKVRYEDTLGEVHCTLLTRRARKVKNVMSEAQLMNSPKYWSNRASSGWGGDRVLLVDREKEQGLLWLTFWDSVEDREQFVRSYSRYFQKKLGFESASSGRAAVFCFGCVAKDSDRILALTREEARLDKGGKPWSID